MFKCKIKENRKRKFCESMKRKINFCNRELYIILFVVFLLAFVYPYKFMSILISIFFAATIGGLVNIIYVKKLKDQIYGLKDLEVVAETEDEYLIITNRIMTMLGPMYKKRVIYPNNIEEKGDFLKIQGNSTYALVKDKEDLEWSIQRNPNNETVYLPNIFKMWFFYPTLDLKILSSYMGGWLHQNTRRKYMKIEQAIQYLEVYKERFGNIDILSEEIVEMETPKHYSWQLLSRNCSMIVPNDENGKYVVSIRKRA